MLQTWRLRVQALKREAYALYLAARDPRTPWYARLVAGLVVAYAFSPIDLIPDVIPVLGLLEWLRRKRDAENVGGYGQDDG